MSKVRFANRTIQLPANRALRMCLGGTLVLAGMLGFLPVLGFWMIPLGLVVLSVDLPVVRRWRRRATVALSRWWMDARNWPVLRWFRSRPGNS